MKPLALSIEVKSNEESSESEYSTDSEDYDEYMLSLSDADPSTLDTPQLTNLYTDRNQFARTSITTPQLPMCEFALNDLVEVRNNEDDEWKFGIVKRSSPLMVTLKNSLLRRKFKFVRHADPADFPIADFFDLEDGGEEIESDCDDLPVLQEDSEFLPSRAPSNMKRTVSNGSFSLSKRLNSDSSYGSDDSCSKSVRWRPSFLPGRDHYSCEELISTIDDCLRASSFDDKLIQLIRMEFLFLDLDFLQKKRIRIDGDIACTCGDAHTPVLTNASSKKKCYVYLKPNQTVKNSSRVQHPEVQDSFLPEIDDGSNSSQELFRMDLYEDAETPQTPRQHGILQSKEIEWALQSKEVPPVSPQPPGGVPRTPSQEWEIVLYVGSRIFQWILFNQIISSKKTIKQKRKNREKTRHAI